MHPPDLRPTCGTGPRADIHNQQKHIIRLSQSLTRNPLASRNPTR